jgi:uncharacterized membrane protein
VIWPRAVRTGQRLLRTAVVLWALLVVAAPWLASIGSPLDAAVRVSAAAYLVGGLVCHQRADRSFHVHGGQLPVCGRCTGLYLGAAVGMVAAWPFRRRSARLPRLSWRAILAVAAVPTIATIVLEWAGAWSASPSIRAAAAAPLGAVVGALLSESMSFRGRLDGCERMRRRE